MALACKCDKCGQFFEISHEGKKTTKKVCIGEVPFGCQIGNGIFGDRSFDLCNSCYNLLLGFLKEGDGQNEEPKDMD